MDRSETEIVLANWILQAISEIGQFDEGVEPSKWIAVNFLNWWNKRIDDSLSDAEHAAISVRNELNRIGGWNNQALAGALHELTHLVDALGELRGMFEQSQNTSEG